MTGRPHDDELEIRGTKDVPPEAILELFRHAEWTQDRSREGIVAARAHTPVVVTAWRGKRCVGLVRVLTDGVYRALIEDVIVHLDERGSGISRLLIEAALDHLLVRDVEVAFLFTGIPDLYAPFGFVPDPGGMKLVRHSG